MFKSLVKLIFPSSTQSDQPNYYYFEELQKSAAEAEETKVAPVKRNTTLPPKTFEQQHEHEFYDFLFGQSPSTVEHDELSLFIETKISELIQNPQDILKSLPVLPLSLTKIIDNLNADEFNTDSIISLINKEPIIAAKVVELANSPYYKRGDKEVVEIKSAFMTLGANGLMEGVINGFISNLLPKNQIYFQNYGNRIWQHSLSTGVIAKTLIKQSDLKQDASQAYLIGLICNLGDMIIFQLMMEAFSVVHPDSQPNSYAFKQVMQRHSKRITYHIAKYWQFPTSLLDALVVQTKITSTPKLEQIFDKRPMACFIYEANIISELVMQADQRKSKDSDAKDELKNKVDKLLVSPEAHAYMNNYITENYND